MTVTVDLPGRPGRIVKMFDYPWESRNVVKAMSRKAEHTRKYGMLNIPYRDD